MNSISPVPTREPGVKCVACQTHSRPLYVPWHQHAFGCSVRAAELQRQALELRPPIRVGSRVAA